MPCRLLCGKSTGSGRTCKAPALGSRQAQDVMPLRAAQGGDADQAIRLERTGSSRSCMLRRASTVVSQSMQASVTETP